LCPFQFNICISDSLLELQTNNCGVSIGNYKYNTFAYADDVGVFCSRAIGLQKFINICYTQSKNLNFNFGIKKTKCLTVDEDHLEIFGTI